MRTQHPSTAQAALERYARRRHAVDPADRLAGLVADAHLAPPLSLGQQRQAVEQIHAAGAELIERRPYLRRGLEEVLDALEAHLLDEAAPENALLPEAPSPLERVLSLAAQLDTDDEDDDEGVA